jgi:hypothetical protein
MKTAYIAGAAIVAFILLQRGKKKDQAANQLQDTMASQKGSDWIGAGGLFAMWDRLAGKDLVAPGYPNMDPSSAVADPGKIGIIQTGLTPGWNGSLG